MNSNVSSKKLTRRRLQQLIATARGLGAASQEPHEAQEYDWFKPHHFRPEHLAAFDQFARKLEKQIATTFDTLCQGEYQVSVKSYDQHFADRLAAQVRAECSHHYFMPVDVGDDLHSGYLAVAPQTALALVGYMLRDPNLAAGEQRELTTLEDCILVDITSYIIDAAAVVFKQAGGPPVKKTGRVVRGDWPLSVAGIDDLFSIEFSVASESDSIDMALTLRASTMEPILGIKASPGPKPSPQQIQKTILENVHHVPVEIEARLTEAHLSLNDAMSLRPGDILLLGKKVSEPLEMLLNRRPCFHAHLARTSSRYALVLAGPVTR